MSSSNPIRLHAASGEWGARAAKALDVAIQFGGVDGDHHKAWVIDQMVRALTGFQYDEIVADAKSGEDGPESYEWNVGIPP